MNLFLYPSYVLLLYQKIYSFIKNDKLNDCLVFSPETNDFLFFYQVYTGKKEDLEITKQNIRNFLITNK